MRMTIPKQEDADYGGACCHEMGTGDRCGSDHGDTSCPEHLPYCNTATGYCGQMTKYFRDAQLGFSYDWECSDSNHDRTPVSCCDMVEVLINDCIDHDNCDLNQLTFTYYSEEQVLLKYANNGIFLLCSIDNTVAFYCLYFNNP